MAEPFRYSPRANRAADVGWREWNADAFAEADRSGRPIFLLITAVWCAACHELDETTLSDPELIALLRNDFVPIRVDSDRLPHVQERYISGGWPTASFLTPTGEVLWAAPSPDAPVLLGAARGVTQAWQERRAEFEAEIRKRRRAFQAAQGRVEHGGLVRREASEAVVQALRAAFDPRNGGFGEPPRFPPSDTLELLFSLEAAGDAHAGTMAISTLDGILAGELYDAVDGGFYRYALAADWTDPCREKRLDVNAGMLRAFACGAARHQRTDWQSVAERTVEWVETSLARSDGLWAVAQLADETWFRYDAAMRRRMAPPPADTTSCTDSCAAWIAALAEAGAALEKDVWIERAYSALGTLIACMMKDSLLFHWIDDGEPQQPWLLNDAVALLNACISVHAATDRPEALEQARSVTRLLEQSFWADSGGFWDHVEPEPLGAVRDRQRPFLTNARAASALLSLARATGERTPRALAERTLAILSRNAARYGTDAAAFVIACNAFFNTSRLGV